MIRHSIFRSNIYVKRIRLNFLYCHIPIKQFKMNNAYEHPMMAPKTWYTIYLKCVWYNHPLRSFLVIWPLPLTLTPTYLRHYCVTTNIHQIQIYNMLVQIQYRIEPDEINMSLKDAQTWYRRLYKVQACRFRCTYTSVHVVPFPCSPSQYILMGMESVFPVRTFITFTYQLKSL